MRLKESLQTSRISLGSGRRDALLRSDSEVAACNGFAKLLEQCKYLRQ